MKPSEVYEALRIARGEEWFAIAEAGAHAVLSDLQLNPGDYAQILDHATVGSRTWWAALLLQLAERSRTAIAEHDVASAAACGLRAGKAVSILFSPGSPFNRPDAPAVVPPGKR